MDQNANKLVVRRLVEEAQQGRNVQLVDELLADDFIDHTPMGGLPPTREGVKLLFAGLQDAFPDLTVTVEEQIAEGTQVVTRKTFRGTHSAPFLGVAASGRSVEFEVIDILKVEGGRITEHRHVIDQLALLRQLGAFAA
jgi:steroid delta-isomerase-like uncharacterized protein